MSFDDTPTCLLSPWFDTGQVILFPGRKPLPNCQLAGFLENALPYLRRNLPELLFLAFAYLASITLGYQFLRSRTVGENSSGNSVLKGVYRRSRRIFYCKEQPFI